MLSFFVKHVEKLILGIFMVALLAVLWTMIAAVKDAQHDVTVLEDLPNAAVSRTGDLKRLKESDFNAPAVLQDTRLVWVAGGNPDERPTNLFALHKYIQCANAECLYVMPFVVDVCPECGTNQGDARGKIDAPISKDGDMDGDLIPDWYEEKYHFLDPKVAADALRDFDGDGFTNLEEFLAGTAPDDPASHPPLIEKLRLVGVKKQSLPVLFYKLDTYGAKDKANWDIFLKVVENGREKLKIARVGDVILDYKIIDINQVRKLVYDASTKSEKLSDFSEVTLQKEGQEPVLLVLGKTTQESGLILTFVYLSHPTDMRQLKPTRQSGDEPISLTDTVGQKEVYDILTIGAEQVRVKAVNLPGNKKKEGEEFNIQKFNRLVDMQRPPGGRAGAGEDRADNEAPPMRNPGQFNPQGM